MGLAFAPAPSARSGEGLLMEAFPAHGFADDEPTRRLLRSRPPKAALVWAGTALGGRVVSTQALRGGISSAVHLLRVEVSGGAQRTAVLRLYVRPEVISEDPDIAGREASVLSFLAGSGDHGGIGVPTPSLLAVDVSGSEAGVPALVMSHLAGRVDWWPKRFDPWLGKLADLLSVIHATALPSGFGPPGSGQMPTFSPYRQSSYEPPPWARSSRTWEMAFEIFHMPAHEKEVVFIQRDFHPGNVLWRRGSVSGVVDWQAACVGPPAVDVGHCRTNLFRFGMDVADRFTTLWEMASGRSYDPWSEVVSIVGILDTIRTAPRPDRLAMEEALSRAVGELSPSY